MGRSISIELQDHLDAGVTTLCKLVRIDPVAPGYASYGVTTLDRDVTYHDGISEIVYSAAVGAQLTTLAATGDLSVDNAENTSLMPEFDIPISEADIAAGVYDFARFTVYVVNYEDLTQGHIIPPNGYGTLGRITIDDNGLSFVEELVGLSKELKQTICPRDSLGCRATFGSQPVGTGGGVVEEHQPCGIDAEALFVDGIVTSVGLETNRTFTDSGQTEVEDYYALGLVRWVTGANAGRENEIESSTDTGEIQLAFPTGFPIKIGDTYKRRQGCSKIARDELRGCKYHWGAEWPMHFDGEPDIPIGDAVANATPGATVGPGGGGSSNTQSDEA